MFTSVTTFLNKKIRSEYGHLRRINSNENQVQVFKKKKHEKIIWPNINEKFISEKKQKKKVHGNFFVL